MAKRSEKKSPAKSVTSVNIPPPANAADVPSTYANMIEMLSANHIDVRFAFNEVAVDTGNVARSIRRANIVMPTAAFMTMMQILNGNLRVLLAKVPQQAAQNQQNLAKIIESHVAAAESQSQK